MRQVEGDLSNQKPSDAEYQTNQCTVTPYRRIGPGFHRDYPKNIETAVSSEPVGCYNRHEIGTMIDRTGFLSAFFHDLHQSTSLSIPVIFQF